MDDPGDCAFDNSIEVEGTAGPPIPLHLPCNLPSDLKTSPAELLRSDDYRLAARRKHCDGGRIYIDEDATLVFVSDGGFSEIEGAYVPALVWVDKGEAG